MNRQQKIKLFIDIKQSLLLILEKAFDNIDEELDKFTFTKDDTKLIRAARARLAIKSVRQDTLRNIKEIGQGYENLEE